MKKDYYVLALILLPVISYAQAPLPMTPITVNVKVNKTPLPTSIRKSPLYVVPDEGYISKENYPEVYNNNISYILTGSNNIVTWGNYISINPAKPTATLSYSYPIFSYSKDTINYNEVNNKLIELGSSKLLSDKTPEEKIDKIGMIITGSISGGATDDVVSVVKNKKFSTNVDAKINFAIPIANNFFYWKSDKQDLKLSKERFLRNFAYKIYANELQMQRLKLENIAITDTTSGTLVAVQNKEKLVKNRQELHSIWKDGDKLAHKVYKDSVRAVELKANWSSIRSFWIDISAQAKQQKNYLYDSDRVFTKRVIEADYLGYKFGIAGNLYWISEAAFLSWFSGLLRLEYNFSRANNINELSSMDITTTTKTDSFNITRTISDKTSAYDFKKYKKSYYHDFRTDVIKRINDRVAFHVNYNMRLPFGDGSGHGEFFDPDFKVHNITAGFILAFTDKSDTKSKLNIEPYIRYRDLTDQYKEPNLRRFQRNEIGIYLTLPLAYRMDKYTKK